MARKKTAEKPIVEKTPRQVEIEELRALGRYGRDTTQNQRLSELVAEEKRDRFVRLLPKRLENLSSALRGITNLANVQSYVYTQEEADNIVGALTNKVAEIKRLFTGAPKEKGMYDL